MTSRQSILALLALPIADEALAELAPLTDRVAVERAAASDADLGALLDRHPDTEVLYTLNGPRAWGSRWRVRWIQLHSAGVDHLSLDTIPPGVRLTTASGIHSTAMAEHAFALILALRRRIPWVLRLQARRQWVKDRGAEYTPEILAGQTIGILGYGSVGREIARLAQAFGMRVLAVKRSPAARGEEGFRQPGTGDPDGTIPSTIFGPNDLHRLLPQCDVVVNILPATGQTDHLLGASAFEAMRAGALFVNLGRGKTVDEGALAAALRRGHLGGAGLDVFETEPLPAASPLWELETVIVSPHLGGGFLQYDQLCMRLFRENLIRYLDARPLLNEVDRAAGY